MSFLRDKQIRRRNKKLVVLGIIGALVFVLFFTIGSRPLLSTGYRVAEPFWQLRNRGLDQVEAVTDLAFRSKKDLLSEVAELRDARIVDEVRLLRAGLLEKENTELRQALGNVWPEESWLVAGVLVRPPSTPYDVVVLDVGSEDGVVVQQLVFSRTGVILGVVQEVVKKQSFVTLFSTPGMNTQVVIAGQGVAVTAEGKGGGVYELHVPRDVVIAEGDAVVLPGRQTEVLGEIQKIIFDPRDPFQTAFVSAPINFYQERLVYVSDRTLDDIPEVETVIIEILDGEGVTTTEDDVLIENSTE